MLGAWQQLADWLAHGAAELIVSHFGLEPGGTGGKQEQSYPSGYGGGLEIHCDLHAQVRVLPTAVSKFRCLLHVFWMVHWAPQDADLPGMGILRGTREHGSRGHQLNCERGGAGSSGWGCARLSPERGMQVLGCKGMWLPP